MTGFHISDAYPPISLQATKATLVSTYRIRLQHLALARSQTLYRILVAILRTRESHRNSHYMVSIGCEVRTLVQARTFSLQLVHFAFVARSGYGMLLLGLKRSSGALWWK